MADTWPAGDPLEDGAGVGWLSAMRGIATRVGEGASAGFGLGDASAGMTPDGNTSPPRIAQAGAALGQLGRMPGAGSLWTLNGGTVEILPKGWLVIGGAVVVLWMLGGRR